MKKIICVFLAALLCLLLFGCGKTVTMEEIVDGVETQYQTETGASGIVYSGEKLSSETACSLYGLNPSDIKDICVEQSATVGYCDTIIAVRAKNADSAAAIKAALEAKREAMIEEYRQIPINGSYQRAKGSMITTRDNCVFFFCVGVMPADTDAPLEFELDLQTCMNALNALMPVKN